MVYDLPEGNALEVAAKLLADDALGNVPNAVSFENIPYLSPVCHGCGCAGSHGTSGAERDGSPSALTHIPNDSLFASQWGLQRINAPRAWPITKGDPNIVIAVLDQGVELGHPDLHLWPISYSTITHTDDGSPVGNHASIWVGSTIFKPHHVETLQRRTNRRSVAERRGFPEVVHTFLAFVCLPRRLAC